MPAGIRPTAIVGIRMLLVAEVAGAGTCDYIVFLRAPPHLREAYRSFSRRCAEKLGKATVRF